MPEEPAPLQEVGGDTVVKPLLPSLLFGPQVLSRFGSRSVLSLLLPLGAKREKSLLESCTHTCVPMGLSAAQTTVSRSPDPMRDFSLAVVQHRVTRDQHSATA